MSFRAQQKLFPFSRFTVSGNSMFPALKPGQEVLVFNWWRLLGLRVGDIAVIKKNGKELVKRIGQISSDRSIFVIGDNQKFSTDSRTFGLIKESEILGKVIWY